MKKRIIRFMTIVLVVGLFLVTGCTNKNTNSTKEDNTKKEKVSFTKEVVKRYVKYKVPEDISELGTFHDLGVNCMIYYYTNQSSVYALYPFDDKVDTVNKVTINGVEYETYKYEDNSGLHYVYRTQVGNNYHLFQYDVYKKEYDDSQVEKFMNTVEFINE